MMMAEYRVKHTIGRHWEWRWEVQEKYFYYDKGELIIAWHMVYYSTKKEHCIEVMEKYINNPPKKWGISWEDALLMW